MLLNSGGTSAPFWKFYESRHKHFGFPTNPSDWLDALRELDGNFIKTTQIGKDIVVSFHNPSIRDFMEQFLADSDRDAVDLLRGAAFYEQYLSLWSGVNDRPYPGIEQAGREFLGALGTNLWGPIARMIRTEQGGETIGVTSRAPSNESRAEFFIRVADDVAGRPAADAIPLLQSMSSLWREGSADREDLVRLLDKLRERGLTTDDPVFTAARQCLMAPHEMIEDFRAAAKFCDTYPDIVSDAERGELKRQFEGFAPDYTQRWDTDSDPDRLREIAGDIEGLAERLGGLRSWFGSLGRSFVRPILPQNSKRLLKSWSVAMRSTNSLFIARRNVRSPRNQPRRCREVRLRSRLHFSRVTWISPSTSSTLIL